MTFGFLPFFTVLGAVTVIRGTTLSTVTCTVGGRGLVGGVPDVAEGELVRAGQQALRRQHERAPDPRRARRRPGPVPR